MDRHEIARALEEMALLLELSGENPFKVRAYANASRIMEGLSDDISALIERDELVKIKGIGRALADHIVELARTGKIEAHEDLRRKIPPGVMEMLSIPGVGPKKAHYLWKERGIKTVGELEQLCRRHLLAGDPGFGEKTEEKILAGIDMLKRFAGKSRLDEALEVAEEVIEHIRSWREVELSEIGGSLRRRMEVVHDIDILVAAEESEKVMERFVTMPDVERVIQRGETKSEVILASGIQCDLRTVLSEQFPFALHYFTGSKDHNVEMRRIAKDKGLKLNEYGLFKGESSKSIKCSDEAAVFAALGLDFIPPEMRENMGEIEAASSGSLPELVEVNDIKGVVHAHSNYTDGEATIKEMADAARSMGYSYLAITDHSQAVRIAGGMKPAEVKKQHKEIDGLNKRLKGFWILKGIEVDILEDGSLDFDEAVLAGFDLVIAAVHSRFGMSEDEMTKRIVKALSNPFVHMLAHPTGRLILSREPYAVDMKKVIDAASKHGVALEINAHPQRLDLDWRWCRPAKERGVKMSINPDAHSIAEIENIRYGVGVARKGWLEKGDILNCLSAKQLLAHLKK